MARRFIKKLKSTQKQFIKVEGADHYNLGKVGGEEYAKKVEAFIEKCIPK